MTKIAKLKDGVTTIKYSSIEELQFKLPAPYNAFLPVYEYQGLLIGREGVLIGTYINCKEDSEYITNMDEVWW